VYTQQAETTIPGTEGVVRARRRHAVEAIGLDVVEAVVAVRTCDRYARLRTGQSDRHAGNGLSIASSDRPADVAVGGRGRCIRVLRNHEGRDRGSGAAELSRREGM